MCALAFTVSQLACVISSDLIALLVYRASLSLVGVSRLNVFRPRSWADCFTWWCFFFLVACLLLGSLALLPLLSLAGLLEVALWSRGHHV